jgi:hypothetical protein
MLAAALFLTSGAATAQEKILGPWLWMVLPTEPGQGGAAATDVDYLARASNGVVTEEAVASNGVRAGDRVAGRAYRSAAFPPAELDGQEPDNVNALLAANGIAAADLDDHVAYAFLVLTAPEEQKGVLMRVGSDDSVKVWLNGEVVHKNAIDRPCSGFQDTFPVHLRAGENRLLVKVSDPLVDWTVHAGILALCSTGDRGYRPV